MITATRPRRALTEPTSVRIMAALLDARDTARAWLDSLLTQAKRTFDRLTSRVSADWIADRLLTGFFGGVVFGVLAYAVTYAILLLLGVR